MYLTLLFSRTFTSGRPPASKTIHGRYIYTPGKLHFHWSRSALGMWAFDNLGIVAAHFAHHTNSFHPHRYSRRHLQQQAPWRVVGSGHDSPSTNVNRSAVCAPGSSPPLLGLTSYVPDGRADSNIPRLRGDLLHQSKPRLAKLSNVQLFLTS